MYKAIALPLLLLTSAAWAQDAPPLEVDVVGGIQAPMAIAVPVMPTAGTAEAANPAVGGLGRQISAVIASDLRASGLFTPLGPDGIGGYSYAEASSPAFPTWRSAGAQLLATGRDGLIHQLTDRVIEVFGGAGSATGLPPQLL